MVSSLHRMTGIALCVTCLCAFAGGNGTVTNASNASYLEEAALGIGTLQNWYNWTTGLWRTTGWWNSANALTALVNYSRLSGSTSYESAIENTYSVNASGGFLNYYYDDEGWWALAWIEAYDWTQNPTYLNAARTIFTDMTGGWDDTCGGGIWWSRARTYKNAIANELFLSVAARLANRVTDPDDQAQLFAWAEYEWQWFVQSGMINSQSLINDGLNGNCQNNHQTTWTYNQGVILGGLAELSQQDPDPSLTDVAQAVALAAIDNLTDANGILHDRCEPNCGRDGVQFKGIFVRNLMALNDSFPDARYVGFAETNAQSIWNADQGDDYQFGLIWSGPFDSGDAARQSSALDALIAAAAMAPDSRPGASRQR
jgi:predicted alpha-1,6-mannanase (GH76 family)